MATHHKLPPAARQAPGESPRGMFVAMGLIAAALLLLGVGSWIGLFRAPPEHYMGEVQRIMYVHVPTAWIAMLTLTFAFVAAMVFLFKQSWRWDCLHEAALELGVLLAFLLCVQGAVWAKPTWGVWWDWDPRLTTTAVMLFAFLGILALRRFVDDPVKRATWSAIATIIAYADVPIVYFSVRWWNSLHQVQSTPETVASAMITPLRINAFGMLLLVTGFLLLRSRVAARRLREELAIPPAPQAPVSSLGELASGGEA